MQGPNKESTQLEFHSSNNHEETNSASWLSEVVARFKQSHLSFTVDDVGQLELSASLKNFLMEIIQYARKENAQATDFRLLKELKKLHPKEIEEISTTVDVILTPKNQKIIHQSVQHQYHFSVYSEAPLKSHQNALAHVIATARTTKMLIEGVRDYYSTGDNACLRSVLGSKHNSLDIREAFINFAIVKKEYSSQPKEIKNPNAIKETCDPTDIIDRRMLNTYEQIF